MKKLRPEQSHRRSPNLTGDLTSKPPKTQAGTLSLQNELAETNDRLVELRSELENCQSNLERLIEERKKVEEALKKSRELEHYLANYDSLTDLPNRLLFQDRLKQSLAQARRNGLIVAILFLDLDGFKIINDTLGHSIGDLLLQNVARRLHACIREIDTTARWGGDEFCVILNRIPNRESVAKVVEKILAEISHSYSIQNRELFITTSLGISVYPSDGEDEETLVKNADVAMFSAKKSGKNKYEFYDSKLDYGEEHLARMKIENSLLSGLDRKEFEVHYQPQFSLGSGRIVGMEALIRWNHPSLGLISPATFIPLAEDTGMIIPIGEWVLRTACLQIKEWQTRGYPAFTVGVNVSVRQFHHPKFVKTVEEILQESQLDPRYLELEITENIVMKNTEFAVDVLRKLKALGINISIDDFGTGYSSLSYLISFPVDKLKIDQSFVRSLAEEKTGKAITQAIIALAHSLGHKAIIEGVETERQRDILCSLNCDEMQGFLFSRPLAVHETEKFMDAQNRLGQDKR